MTEPQDESLRGTGRTTACVLSTIAKALHQPGEWVEFVDHDTNSDAFHFSILRGIEGLVSILGLKMSVKLIKRRVCVRSDIKI